MGDNCIFSVGRRTIMGINNTRQITIPQDWLRNRGLDKGNKVELYLTDNGDLVIKPVQE